MIAMAREVNNYKADWCAEKVQNAMLRFEIEKKRVPIVAMMGLAFKPDIDDLRESPGQIYRHQGDAELQQRQHPGCRTQHCQHNVFKLTDYREAYQRADIVVFLTAHDVFKTLEWSDDKVILDFCGIFKR